jgi:hypothetical protein
MSPSWRYTWSTGWRPTAPPICQKCRDDLRNSSQIRCKGPCAQLLPRDAFRLDKRYANGTGIKSRICRDCENTRTASRPRTEQLRGYYRNLTRARRRARKGGGKTYDGVTDRQIYQRDAWECQIPACQCPAGRAINPKLRNPDPWSASIDHIIPLSLNGSDDARNKRASHLRCNAARGAGG